LAPSLKYWFPDYHRTMPFVTVKMAEGHTSIEKERLAKAITRDFTRILKVPEEAVTIVYEETPKGNAYRGGKLHSPQGRTAKS